MSGMETVRGRVKRERARGVGLMGSVGWCDLALVVMVYEPPILRRWDIVGLEGLVVASLILS